MTPIPIGATIPAKIPTTNPKKTDRYFKKNKIPIVCRLIREKI